MGNFFRGYTGTVVAGALGRLLFVFVVPLGSLPPIISASLFLLVLEAIPMGIPIDGIKNSI